MFKDEVYEGMDDVSRIFEPFNYKLNDELAEFPDKIEVPHETFFSESSYWGGYGAYAHDFLAKAAEERSLAYIVRNSRQLISDGFFAFEVEDLEEGETITFDAKESKLSHKIFLVKREIAYDEQKLEAKRKELLFKTLRNYLYHTRDMNKGRFNEVADIYGAHEAKSDRSAKGKLAHFINHMEKMIDEKILDIRDMELCEKFANWIVWYVRDGNLAALNNLTRIKIITHEKRPIYSIEEKEA